MSNSSLIAAFSSAARKGVSRVSRDAAGALTGWLENGFELAVIRNVSANVVSLRLSSGQRAETEYFYFDALGNCTGTEGEHIPSAFADEVMSAGARGSSVARLAQDSSGNTVGIADSVGGGVIPFSDPKWGKNRRGYPLAANITSASGLVFTGQSGNTPTVEYITRDGMRGVRITTAVGFWAEIAVPAFSKLVQNGRLEALMYVPDGSTAALSTSAVYIGDTGYANGYTASIVHSNTGCNQHPGYFTIAPDPVSSPADTVRLEWAATFGAPTWAGTTMTAAKLRITPTAAMSAVVEIFGIWVNGSNTFPSIVFSADDGYDSTYSLGLPVFEKYGHKLSMAIISDLIGTPGYMTTQNLVDAVARGHECVVHGPIGGSGSLPDNYTTTAQIFADVSYHRQFLISNGLAKNGSENVYVFPQGKYQHARDDTRVMDAIRQAGFKYARLANTNQSSVLMVDQRRLPYYLPIIGHTWVSVGTEVANIARIIAKIQEAVAQGRSVVLMFHKFTAGASANAIEIQTSNLELICQAVSDLEASGAAKNTLLTGLFKELEAPAVQ